MSRSFTQSVEVTCVGCSQPFEASVWLIVDAAERPDLVEQIKAQVLHIATCPHCGVAHPLEAPLLFHDPAQQLLLFVARERSSAEDDQQAARELGQQLIASIPVAERQPYLATAHTVWGSAGLSRVLNGEIASQGDELSIALQALMEATSEQDVRNVAETHPLLTRSDAQAQLRQYVEQLQAAGQGDLAAALNYRIRLLEQPRAHGTLSLIEALLAAESPSARKAELRRRTHEITPDIPNVLAALAAQAQRQQLPAVARDLLVIRDEVAHYLDLNPSVEPNS